MAINKNKIIVNKNHPVEYLSRDLEPLDSINLWGVVKAVKGYDVFIEICDIKVSADKFSGSTSGCIHSETIKLRVQDKN